MHQRFIRHLLATVTCSYLEFVVNWVQYGELLDPHREFFVLRNSTTLSRGEKTAMNLSNTNTKPLASAIKRA